MAITFEPKKAGRPTNRPKTPEEIKAFFEAYQVTTSNELADQYGVKPGTVRAWAYALRREEDE